MAVAAHHRSVGALDRVTGMRYPLRRQVKRVRRAQDLARRQRGRGGRNQERDGKHHDTLTHRNEYSATLGVHSAAVRSRSALAITDTELKLIAAAAIMGDSSRPVNGYRIPAATGTPAAL